MTVIDVTTQAATRGHRVAVAGELDMATVPDLRSCLGALDGAVTLDCADVTFIDSVGIELFIETHLRLAKSGGRFVLTNLQHACRRVLELMKLDEVLTLEG